VEDGRFPTRDKEDRYRQPLIDKKTIAISMRVSVRTVETWMSQGLPLRRVFGVVRFNPQDACDWLNARFELAASPEIFRAK
jgi:phage terminase Nu1 subunit (DNA packaging protein)